MPWESDTIIVQYRNFQSVELLPQLSGKKERWSETAADDIVKEIHHYVDVKKLLLNIILFQRFYFLETNTFCFWVNEVFWKSLVGVLSF